MTFLPPGERIDGNTAECAHLHLLLACFRASPPPMRLPEVSGCPLPDLLGTGIIDKDVFGVLGPGHPCGDAAALLVSEIFTNSVRHSGSGAAGETVTVAVRAWDSTVRVEVTDRSGPGVPEPRPADRDAEGGRGLQLVAGLATRWGWRRRRGGRTVTWFEIQALLQAMQHSAVPDKGVNLPDLDVPGL
jgi:anti-sigma regulatory factor (Ser/Thr protein kinase)